MHLLSVIEELGYSRAEAEVYLAALQMGGSSVTELAAKTKMPRTTVNDVVNSLHAKGLLNAYVVHRRKKWTADNPEKLLIRLREREAALKVILPELQSFHHDTGAPARVRTYAGAEELKQIMADIIDTKHHISAIVSWDEWIRILGRTYVDDFIERRRRHFLKIHLLTPRTKTSAALKSKDDAELRATRFLPAEAGIRNSNFIYANKVAIISLRDNHPTGILIEDDDVTHTMQVLFDSLWQRCAK